MTLRAGGETLENFRNINTLESVLIKLDKESKDERLFMGLLSLKMVL